MQRTEESWVEVGYTWNPIIEDRRALEDRTVGLAERAAALTGKNAVLAAKTAVLTARNAHG